MDAPCYARYVPLTRTITQRDAGAPMDTNDATALDVLTDDELAQVIGGTDVSKLNAQHFVYGKIGMCGCGLAH